MSSSSPSSTSSVQLLCDPSHYIDGLLAMDTVSTPIGDIPDVSKGDLIAALAPIYIEVGRFVRAALGFKVLFGNPFPYPFLTSSNPGLLIEPKKTGMILFDLAKAQHVLHIPEGPHLIVNVKISARPVPPMMIHPFSEADDPRTP